MTLESFFFSAPESSAHKAQCIADVVREILRYCNNRDISCVFSFSEVLLEIAISSGWCKMSEDDPEPHF